MFTVRERMLAKASGAHRPVVAFQGEHGAYSEEATLAFFGESLRTKPCRALKEVFRDVEGGAAEFGVVPVENSLEGSVNQTYDCLLQSPLRVCAELKLRVSHCLLGLPGTSSQDIRVVYSHPQALAQCSVFLETLRAVEEPVYDTAGSAKMIREKDMRDAAAIASEKAATLYGLNVLKKGIEDFSENFTRFLVVGQSQPAQTGRDKTSMVFGTKHSPGALHQALGQLATRGINLTKIESRPIKGKPWEYVFFVDFEGHQSDPVCFDALDALESSTTFVKFLGSYPLINA